MTKVKISVVKSFSKKGVFGDELPDDLKGTLDVCGIHRPGQEYYFDGAGCPEGICPWAFSDIFRDVVILWRGSDFPWVGKPGVMYSACTDGTKPVVFKLERIED